MANMRSSYLPLKELRILSSSLGFFYPVFHITAVTAYIADNRYFPEQGDCGRIDIISARISAVIRNAFDFC